MPQQAKKNLRKIGIARKLSPARAQKKRGKIPPSKINTLGALYAPPEGFRPSRRAELATTHTDDAL